MQRSGRGQRSYFLSRSLILCLELRRKTLKKYKVKIFSCMSWMSFFLLSTKFWFPIFLFFSWQNHGIQVWQPPRVFDAAVNSHLPLVAVSVNTCEQSSSCALCWASLAFLGAWPAANGKAACVDPCAPCAPSSPRGCSPWPRAFPFGRLGPYPLLLQGRISLSRGWSKLQGYHSYRAFGSVVMMLKPCSFLAQETFTCLEFLSKS